MRKVLLKIVCVVIGLLVTPVYGEVPAPIIKAVKWNVFEVVKKKGSSENISFLETPNYSVIAYGVRADNYYSIGTAFYIGNGHFLTAAHVLGLTEDTLNPTLYIRDGSKNVFEINLIHKFTSHRDFVEFSVKKFKPKSTGLRLSKKVMLNQRIYAVGNALGEGVVIRDGQLTSKTKEDFNGEWEWLRFSAAASPGNSGGPLMDESGAVVGIIMMKSQNENLNYALPISEVVNHQTKRAIVKKRPGVWYPNVNAAVLGFYDHEENLPATPNGLQNKFVADYERTYSERFSCIFYPGSKFDFHNSVQGQSIFYSAGDFDFPSLIMQNSSYEWGVFSPSKIDEFKPLNEDKFEFGAVNAITFFKLHRSKKFCLQDYISSPNIVLRALLESGAYKYSVGANTYRFKSIGEPSKNYVLEDRFERYWIYSEWPIAMDDSKIGILYCITPDGCVGLALKTQSSGSQYFASLRAMTQFTLFDFKGTIPQWEEYSALYDYVPSFLKSVCVARNSQLNKLTIYTPSYELEVDNSQFDIKDSTEVELDFLPRKIKGQISLYNDTLYIENKIFPYSAISFSQQLKPIEGLKQGYFDSWGKVSFDKSPYNEVVYTKNGNYNLKKLYEQFSSENAVQNKVVLSIRIDESESKSKLKKLMKELKGASKIHPLIFRPKENENIYNFVHSLEMNPSMNPSLFAESLSPAIPSYNYHYKFFMYVGDFYKNNGILW